MKKSIAAIAALITLSFAQPAQPIPITKLQQELSQIKSILVKNGLSKTDAATLKKKITSLQEFLKYTKAQKDYKKNKYLLSEEYAVNTIKQMYSILEYIKRSVKKNMRLPVFNYIKIGSETRVIVPKKKLQTVINYLSQNYKEYQALKRAQYYLMQVKGGFEKYGVNQAYIHSLYVEIVNYITTLNIPDFNYNPNLGLVGESFAPQGETMQVNNPGLYQYGGGMQSGGQPQPQQPMAAQPQGGAASAAPQNAFQNIPAVQGVQTKIEMVTVKNNEILDPQFDIRVKRITPDYLYIGF